MVPPRPANHSFPRVPVKPGSSGGGVLGNNLVKLAESSEKMEVHRNVVTGDTSVKTGERRNSGLNVEEGHVRVWMPRFRRIRSDSSIVEFFD